MAIQTTLQPGIPGFIVEVTLVPRNTEIIRSKVYVTTRPEVNTTLSESFQLKCFDVDIERCSMLISVKPILGNIVLYAESELKGLDLTGSAEVYLGGFLKGVYSQCFIS